MCVIRDWHLDCMLIAGLLFENYLGLSPDFWCLWPWWRRKIGKLVALLEFYWVECTGDQGFSSQRANNAELRYVLLFSLKKQLKKQVIWYTMTLHWGDMLGRASVTRITMMALWQLDMSLLFKAGINNHIHINVRYDIIWPNVNSFCLLKGSVTGSNK